MVSGIIIGDLKDTRKYSENKLSFYRPCGVVLSEDCTWLGHPCQSAFVVLLKMAILLYDKFE